MSTDEEKTDTMITTYPIEGIVFGDITVHATNEGAHVQIRDSGKGVIRTFYVPAEHVGHDEPIQDYATQLRRIADELDGRDPYPNG